MNLYNLHSNSEELHHFGQAHEKISFLFWDKYKDNPEELKKREHAISKNARCSYLYAKDVLN
jgi:hypothetical protein